MYARWFRCLGDATRIRVVNMLAGAGREMSVGEIVEALDVVQSTVSEHLRVLTEVGFVEVRREGIRRFYRVNQRCLGGFPTAADLVMGRLARRQTGDPSSAAPWACAS